MEKPGQVIILRVNFGKITSQDRRLQLHITQHIRCGLSALALEDIAFDNIVYADIVRQQKAK